MSRPCSHPTRSAAVGASSTCTDGPSTSESLTQAILDALEQEGTVGVIVADAAVPFTRKSSAALRLPDPSGLLLVVVTPVICRRHCRLTRRVADLEILPTPRG